MTIVDPFAIITERVAPGARLIRHWPLEGGVSSVVEALEIALPDGRLHRVVMRRHGTTDWKPLEDNVMTTEYELLKTLYAAGFAVPAPHLLDSSAAILPSSYLVMEYVDGSTELAPNALPDALRQMADYLARLHRLDLGTLRLPDLPRRADPVPDILRRLPGDPLGLRILEALAAHEPIAPTNPPSLLHGDFWPGNILWRDDAIVAVIDWEDAAVGDPLADLASTRVEIVWKHGPEAMEALTDHYLSASAVDLAILPFWEIAVALAGAKYMGKWRLDADIEAEMRWRNDVLIQDALCRISGP